MYALAFIALLFSCLGSGRGSSSGSSLAGGVSALALPAQGLGAGGWLCDLAMPPTAYCGVSASVVGQALPLAAAARCAPALGAGGGGSVVLIGDSVSRHALFDWLAEDEAGCGVAELDGASEEACAALHAAGQRRGNYAVDAPAGGGRLRVRALPDTPSIEAAVQGGAAFTFLSSTFLRNVTAAPWLLPALRAVAASGSPLVLSGGLWNLKYDAQPLATLQTEAQGLLEALRLARVPLRSVLWRGLSATDALAALPAQYTPLAVQEARGWLQALWATAGAHVLDVTPITSCAAAAAGDAPCASAATPASGLTTDGTHLPLQVSLGVMRATLRALCSLAASSGNSAPVAQRQLTGEGGAAAKPAPAAALAPAAPAPPPPAPLGGLLYASAILCMFCLMGAISLFQSHRALLESLLKTPAGAITAYLTVLLAVFLCDVWKAFPIVTKAKPLGFDSMLIFFCFVLAVALRTAAPVAAAPPGQRPGGAGKVSTPERAASPALLAAGGAGAGAGAGSGGSSALSAGGGSSGDAEAGIQAPALLLAGEGGAPLSSAAASTAASGAGSGSSAGGGAAAAASTSSLEAGSLLTLTTAGSAAAAASAAAGSAAAAAAGTGAPPSPDNAGFFPLPQSLEWKGWMMTFFLLYHYWDVKPAYNPIRVAVGAYLFLTGYGNFMSLAKKGPSLQKLAMSVLRINLFTASVMLVTGRGWVLYYIAPLHTLWTCVVYGYYWLPPAIPPLHRLAGILAAIIVVYEVPLLANYLFAPAYPLLGYCGELKEWVFRSRLDAYAPWCGMMFAYLVPTMVQWLDADREEAEGGSAEGAALVSPASGAPPGELLQRALARYPSAPVPIISAAATLGLLRPSGALRMRVLGAGGALLAAHLLHSQMYAMARFEYNNYNRFTEWIPIASFLLLRNLTPALRSVHLRLFAWLGEMSLELYILQFHVWMAEDAKKLVVIFPDFRGVSFLVATTAFVIFSWASSAATGLAMKTIEAQGRTAVLSVAGGLLLLMCGINALPKSCSVGGAGGR